MLKNSSNIGIKIVQEMNNKVKDILLKHNMKLSEFAVVINEIDIATNEFSYKKYVNSFVLFINAMDILEVYRSINERKNNTK